jgi:hypothetical protein
MALSVTSIRRRKDEASLWRLFAVDTTLTSVDLRTTKSSTDNSAPALENSTPPLPFVTSAPNTSIRNGCRVGLACTTAMDVLKF